MTKMVCVQGESDRDKLLAAGGKLIANTPCIDGTIYTFICDDCCASTVFSEVKVVQTDVLMF